MRYISSKFRVYALFLLCLSLIAAFYFSLSFPLFDKSYSTVLEDKDGNLLGATIAPDGQWRFPETDSLSTKFIQSITCFEDQYFYKHWGVNPLSLLRAAWQNTKAGKIVSGGSTLTMQVIRLSRGRERTAWEKIKEIILAVRLELSLSKKEILALYASHAPFGGNVVGIDAAAWRYFGVNPHQLSWAENALLAVLPNSPSLMYPGKNNQELLEKRNRLLKKLWKSQAIDSLTYALAISESLPDRPVPLPGLAPQLLTRLLKEGYQGKRIASTLNQNLQYSVSAIIHRHYQRLKANDIHNAAALVVDIATGRVHAYVGNTNAETEHSPSVDIITAPRSTGSILKPFLYAAMLDEGLILPKSLVPDIPTYIDGFAPQNFSKQFEGAVPADQVVSRSLNVPAVLMLREYGIEKFHHLLKNLGMNTLTHHPGHYGLSLILGGAEGSLWDMVGMYASSARILNHYFKYPEPYRYSKQDVHPLRYLQQHQHKEVSSFTDQNWLNAGALWFTFKAMLEVVRPEDEMGWQHFASARKVAWKTGTSYGHRDAWAVGVTPHYVIGVWVGNADGEGRPGLTGVTAAAPILFDIVNLMPATPWFDMPRSDMDKIKISHKSGYRAPMDCTDTVEAWIPRPGLRSPVSPYHQLIHLDQHGKFRVHGDCEVAGNIQHELWFVLPAVQEWYYKVKYPNYRPLPPYRKDCHAENLAVSSLDLIYPRDNAKIYIPRELDGHKGKTVFEAAHRHEGTTIFWHVDHQFIGETKHMHQMPLMLTPGHHVLTLMDEQGTVLERRFEILQLER